jgi:hypothetical protein
VFAPAPTACLTSIAGKTVDIIDATVTDVVGRCRGGRRGSPTMSCPTRSSSLWDGLSRITAPVRMRVGANRDAWA